MNFLAPLYLVALAGLAVPLVLHLIRRQTRQDQVFSSLMFLSPSPPRVNRRSRIDNWPLLLIRAAVLGLVAFAFARPFLPAAADVPIATANRLRIVLIDRSASMLRQELWKQALIQAESSVLDMTESDAIGLVVYDQSAEVLLAPDVSSGNGSSASKQVAMELLAKLKTESPTWQATSHASALQAAIDQYEAYRASSLWTPGVVCEAVLISDLQVGEGIEQLRALQWPKELKLVIAAVLPKAATNATATLLGKVESNSLPRNNDSQTGVPDKSISRNAPLDISRYRVRLESDPQSLNTPVSLQWGNDAAQPSEKIVGSFEVPPGQSRVVQVNGPSFETGALQLEGDETTFDNSFYFYQPQPKQQRICYISDRSIEADGLELGYFLQKVSSTTVRDLPSVQVVDAMGAEQELDSANPPALVIINSDIKAKLAARLNEFVQAGGKLLLVIDALPRQSDEFEAWWKEMFQDESISMEEASIDDFLLWQNIDFNHPIFAPFNDPKSNNFAKIHFWKARSIRLSEGTSWSTIVSFDSGIPALIQRVSGEGTIYVMTSGWQVTDSQLALSTKFVPMLLNMIARPGERQVQLAWTVGQSVDPIELEGVKTIILPNGQRVAPESTKFTPGQPGLYQCQLADGSQRTIAANLARSECRTNTLSKDQFEQYGIQLDTITERVNLEESARQMRNTELEANQQWWRWLLVTGLVFIGLETLFSARKVKNVAEV